MPERITLDPSEVATARTSFDITDWIKADGIDWGEAAIDAYKADQSRGSSPVDYRVPNRTVQVPLSIRALGGTAFETVRGNLQQKVSRFQQEGGWLKRVTGGGTVFADIVNASLSLSGGWLQATKSADVDATMTLECLPDFYGAEIQLADHTETTLPELLFTETTVQGDYPARVRIVVDEDQAQTQTGLLWSVRSKNYSSAATAAMRYDAESLNPVSPAFKTALSGASGGTVVTNGTISTNWTPILDMRGAGTAYPTHQGTYRVWARCYSPTGAGGVATQARLVWDVGDLTSPVENAAARMPGGSAFYMLDFGEVRLDAAAVGTHRWQGVFQAKGNNGDESFSIDRVYVLSTDDGYGLLKSPPQVDVGLSSYLARDEFNQTAGTLTGKTLPIGGTWSGTGDTDDFSVTSANIAQRTADDDTAPRRQRAGSGTAALVAAQVDIQRIYSTGSGVASNALGRGLGAMVRYVDDNNYLAVAAYPAVSNVGLVFVWKKVGGTTSSIGTALTAVGIGATAGSWLRIQLLVNAAGQFFVWHYPFEAVAGAPSIVGQDTDLATGGALATGGYGIYDYKPSDPIEYTRSFDNFAVWVPSTEAVCFASRSLELRTDGMVRQDSTGSAYGPVPVVRGDLPRLPGRSLDVRTTEVFVKMSRGDFDQLPDGGIDDLSARVTYRPCWLTVPGS